jgi:hypothetical protein
MTSTNIPTTIFSLLNFIQRVKSFSNPLSSVVLLFELSFCFIELFGLTATPARIHSEVGIEPVTVEKLTLLDPFR